MKLKKWLQIFSIIIVTTSACAVENSAMSGSFIAYNDTDHTVTIRVGNFIPTEYKISPHSSELIFVSTDNQNIHISKIN